MTNDKKYDAIIEIMANWNETETIYAWNERCQAYNYDDEIIYPMGEFDFFLCDLTPTEIIRAIDSDFSTDDDYFRDTMYGLESFSDAFDVIDLGELADYCLENNESFDDSDIEDILDEEETEDEENG